MENRPRSRERNVSGEGKDIYRRGSGLGGSRPGNSGFSGRNTGYHGYSDNDDNDDEDEGYRSVRRSRSSGPKIPIWLIVVLFLLFGGGGSGLSSLLGNYSESGTVGSTSSGYSSSYSGGSSSNEQLPTITSSPKPQTTQKPQTSQNTQSQSSNYFTGSYPGYSSSAPSTAGWKLGNNTGVLDTSVVSGSRSKFTEILGNGNDTVTIMVYMCGADLESRSGMATSDIQEMCNASIGNNVNIIVYTGGAKTWQNRVISNSTNQIYQIVSGRVKCLDDNAGNVSMTDPNTLLSFIKYCSKNFPANRNELILWDHGSGSVSGYGYDEKFPNSGSMSLDEIEQALKASKIKFDFIGFDACLMATVSNAVMLSDYADYLIASEETEPGVGWYYTNWISKLSSNTSMDTISIGKNIADDFVDVCAQKCQGQKTTLSVTDLAELHKTVPSKLSAFASSTLDILKDNGYTQVANARGSAREFATSSKVDQVDLVSLASNLNTKAGDALVKAVLGAVKYNRTSSNMTNAYGLSIYFPYQKTSKVNSAVAAFNAIGMSEEYTAVIQKYAAIQTSGQAVSGGSSTALPTLQGTQQTYSGTYSSGTDVITQILTQLMTGTSSYSSGYLGKSIDLEKDVAFIAENRFNADSLVWSRSSDGKRAMYLSEKDWSLVQDLELNVFVDDGKGYIDLGLDNVFDFNDDGSLCGEFYGTWLSINSQPVAYYHVDTVEDGDSYTITGRVPAMLNGERVNLILVFTDKTPNGYVAGAEIVYDNIITDMVAKNLVSINKGDVIDFICDYYSYSGVFQDNYYLGDQLVVNGELTISDVYITRNNINASFRFTDIYQQHYWTPCFN